MYNNYISTNRITAHYTSLCHTGHTRPDGDRRQTHAYPRQSFPGFLPVCMQGTWGWLSSQVWSFPTTWKSQICIHAHDRLTWNNNSPKWGGVINVSTNTPKIICRDSECLPSTCGKAGCSPNFWKFSSLSPKSYLKNIFELTHISKTEPKSCLNFF